MRVLTGMPSHLNSLMDDTAPLASEAEWLHNQSG